MIAFLTILILAGAAKPPAGGGAGQFWMDYLLIPAIKIVVVFCIVLGIVAYLVWVERKVSAFMQARLGPMRVGPWGLLQPVADGIKMLFKEDLIPEKSDRAIFLLAPIIAVVAPLVVLCVVPWGPAWATITNINIGLLFILAVSSVSIVGLVLAGWSSNSKYSLLGGLRSSAQMVSYEVGLGMAVIGPLLFARTLSMAGIIDAQRVDGLPYVFFQPMAFVIYLVCALGETNRAPFDLPEAESELVAGYHTEYSGFRWALFFMGEYTAMIVTSGVAVTLFLGGWWFPWFTKLNDYKTLQVIIGAVVFMSKVMVLIIGAMWFRWTFPRYRYDQLMDLGWKWLIPAGLGNIVLTGILFVIAMPKAEGGLLGLMVRENGRLTTTGWGNIFFILTGFAITIPFVWMLLTRINLKSRDFNLHEQRQLQVRLRKERLDKRADESPAATASD